MVGIVAACSPGDQDSAPTEPTTISEPGSVDEVFVDPEGDYTIKIDPAWRQEEPDAMFDKFHFWSVAPPDHDAEIVSNVGVFVEEVGELDLAGYLKLSVDSGPTFLQGFELVDEGIIEGANGQTLATMEYSDHELHYIGFFAVGHGKAAVATLTASPEQFDSIRAEVAPYLATLTLTEPGLGIPIGPSTLDLGTSERASRSGQFALRTARYHRSETSTGRARVPAIPGGWSAPERDHATWEASRPRLTGWAAVRCWSVSVGSVEP